MFLQIVFAAGSGGGGSFRTTPDATQVPVQSCTEDTWTCTQWSACSDQHTQTRKCELSVDCLSIVTPKPEESASCASVSQLLSSLQCHTLGSVEDRIRCRLQLSNSDLRNELKIAYLPEECRTRSGASQDSCIHAYSSVQPCWARPMIERSACVKNVFGISEIKKSSDACNTQECKLELEKNVLWVVKFKLYDLEERAEWLLEKKYITEDQAVRIIAALEEQKVSFNAAQSLGDRKQVLKNAKKLWIDFLLEVEQ